MRAAIGCRDHSGWAVLVAVGGDPASPTVLARERVVLVDDVLPRQPYHVALDRDLDQAGALVDGVERAAHSGAVAALRSLSAQLDADGHVVAGVGIPAGTADIPTELATILGSHALIHAAEGELYREALASAGSDCDLLVTRFSTKHAISEAAAALGVAADALDAKLQALGKPLGPPWQKDHREAAAAALLVLAG